MESELLDKIYEFQTKINKLDKILKINNYFHFSCMFLLLISSFSVSFLILILNFNIRISYMISISLIVSTLLPMTYLIFVYGRDVKRKKANFIRSINEKIELDSKNNNKKDYKLKIENFNSFQKYNLIAYIYDKTSFPLNNNKFEELYDLIDIRIERYNFSDYITPKAIFIYTVISSLFISIIVLILTALLDVFLEAISNESKLEKIIFLLNMLFIAIIFISTSSALYYVFRTISQPKELSIRRQYLYIKEALKKCEIDFVNNGLSHNCEYMNIINSIIIHSKRYK